MADTIETMQPDPVLRFRLRTLLQATTALAVLAAVAGLFYRSVDADAQRRLLIFWLTLMPCTAAAFFWRLREAWAPGLRTDGRFVVHATNGKRRRRPYITRAFIIIVLLTGYATASQNIASNPTRGVMGEVGEAIYAGLFVAFISSAMLMAFVRRPMFITERGIPLSTRDFVPWHWIHGAQWLPDQPDVMKLRRLAGDLFIEVPKDAHDAMEAFIREKVSPASKAQQLAPGQ